MGGKSKQSQRTKNNARPSSSGRSAELLNNAMNLENWTSPSGGKMTALFPTLNSPIIDQGLTAELSMCIKKLNKKDPITRVKALQELTEVVNNSNVDDVAAALQSWAHYYKILAVDNDCKVREYVQVCHAAIARVLGRRLAPALRQLVPTWLQAQYDDHAPAQTQATNSLKATFPENKLPEVISFCKVEIVTYFLDNLTGSVDKAIINRIDSPEERQLQLQRLVSSSLQGLRFFARHLPDAHAAWLWERLEALLATSAYWKLASHDSPLIRGEWFGAMGSILERFGRDLDAGASGKCARVLLQAASERQPAAAHQLWGCLLALMYSVPDWHKWLDKKDLLTKRILDMLEKGGWGDARRLSDLLLPLLAHLPADMLTKDFYEAFFEAFCKGLDKKNILSSKSERQYWITSLSECLRYLSIQPHDYVVEVTTAVHRTWLKKALATDHEAQLRTNLVKHSATSMAALAKYWLKQSKEPKGEKYDQLVRNFWQNVASTVLGQIDRSIDVDKVTPTIDGHILLLRTLKTAFLSEGKKPLSIKFDGDDTPAPTEKLPPAQEIDQASVERYKHNLNDIAEKLCCGYFELADQKEIIEIVLTPLITVLKEFDSEQLYLALGRQFDASGVYELYEDVLKRWMITDTTRCKPVVDVIFMMLKHLTEEEQEAVLRSFDQFPCGALEWCVSLALSHEQWTVRAVRSWLQRDTVQRTLLQLARRLLRQRCPRARNLLLVCLSHDAPGAPSEMMISTSTAMLIAEMVSAALLAQLHSGGTEDTAEDVQAGEKPGKQAMPEEDLDLEHVTTVAAHLATALAGAASHESYQDLVLNLFQLLVLVPRGSSRLSPESWREARSAAQDGVGALPPPARAPLLRRLAAVLQDRLLQIEGALCLSDMEHLSWLWPGLVLAGGGDARPLCESLLSLRPDPSWKPVQLYALRYDCVVGNLSCPVEDDNDLIKQIVKEASTEVTSELTIKEFVPYANRLLFRAMNLKSLLLYEDNEDEEENIDDEEDNDDEEDSDKSEKSEQDGEQTAPTTPVKMPPKKNACNEYLKDEYYRQQFCDVLHDYVIVCSLQKAYGFWVQNDIIQQTKTKLTEVIQGIVESTAEDIRESILSYLVERALSDGYYWAYAKSCYEEEIKKAPGMPENLDSDKLESLMTGNGFFHTLQASMNRQPDEQARVQVQMALVTRCLALAHAGAALAACGGGLEPVVAFYHQHQGLTLYERSINELSWAACVAEAAVARGTIAVLRERGWDAESHLWDFATVGLCTLMEALRKPHPRYASTKVNLIASAASELYQFVEGFISGIRSECERRQPPPNVFELLNEWRDVFAPALNRDLYLIAVSLLENAKMTITSGLARTVSAIAAAVRQADWRLIDAAHRSHSLGLQRLTDSCCAALARPLHPAYHWLAYCALLRLADPLSDHSTAKLEEWTAQYATEGSDEEDKEGSEGAPAPARPRPQLASEWFREPLTRAAELADAALSGHTAGVDCCEMAAGSDAHAVVLGCLLLSDALHQLTARAKGELQHHYIQTYRENKYTESLLPTAFRLIPGELLSLALRPGNAPLPARYADAFARIYPYSADDAELWSCIGSVACRALSTCCGGAGGGGARGWCGAAGRAARALSRLVAAYVAPRLVRLQLEQLHARRDELLDTEVTVIWATNEARIVYSAEERPVELQVRFERDFPLSLPRVAAPAAKGAATTSWIAVYIAYQNGTILNAVKMWTAALSSQLESAAQCYVCYCRLHPVTGHPPQVRCHQCRNRFHTDCIRKWFVSSHRANCPLCRSHF